MNWDPARPVAVVIIPTHDHPSTLDLAVQSVLTQTVESLDVVIIGDGVGDNTRDVVSGLFDDPRVRFIDAPKSPSRSELVRHTVLTYSRATYACYLGDDDLMLPDHIASTVARLETADFTHPAPVYIDRDGSLRAHPADIADPRSRAWHLVPRRNAISLTGAGHRLEAYGRLPHGWREAPAGAWSDHYMWQQWFRTPGLRFSTGETLTVLKFEAARRVGMTGEQRRAELLEWIDKSAQPGFSALLADDVAAAFRREAVSVRIDHDALHDRHLSDARVWHAEREAVAAEREAVAAERKATGDELEELRAVVATLPALEERARLAEDEAADLRATLDAVLATRTWRLHDRLARLAAARQG